MTHLYAAINIEEDNDRAWGDQMYTLQCNTIIYICLIVIPLMVLITGFIAVHTVDEFNKEMQLYQIKTQCISLSNCMFVYDLTNHDVFIQKCVCNAVNSTSICIQCMVVFERITCLCK